MKLDMGKAWSDAMELLSANFGMIATIVGLFYFLPQFALALLLPGTADPAGGDIPADASPDAAMEAMMAAMQQQYAQNWPFLLLIVLLGYVGAIAVLALLSDRGNPTVGEALKAGIMGTPSYFATQVLFVLAMSLVIGVPLGLVAAFTPTVVAVLVGFALFAFAIYAAFKLLMAPAIIAIEGVLNPVTAMVRSWKMTRGSTLRLFVFLVLLFLTIAIISLIIALVAGLVFSAMGDTVARIGTALVSSITNAAVGGLYLTVLAAIHRQLSGDSGRLARTFE